MQLSHYAKYIFEIKDNASFETIALQAFQYQAQECPVYKNFLNHLDVNPQQINTIADIPFLPIAFFKTQKVITGNALPQQVFTSSGTTGSTQSCHYVGDVSIYEQSFIHAFEIFYGPITDYAVLALLPSYLEREGSSLIYMAERLIKASTHPQSGFYLYNFKELYEALQVLMQKGQKILLLGVSFALLDFAEEYSIALFNTTVMETGGMKGRRKELVREELHELLCNAFGIAEIHSEYGMTELLSQGYSKRRGIYQSPPWMKVLVRDGNDPLSPSDVHYAGGINVIDLANIQSCCFIATQDLGKIHADGSFEVLGRFDNTDIRGCNLMMSL